MREIRAALTVDAYNIGGQSRVSCRKTSNWTTTSRICPRSTLPWSAFHYLAHTMSFHPMCPIFSRRFVDVHSVTLLRPSLSEGHTGHLASSGTAARGDGEMHFPYDLQGKEDKVKVWVGKEEAGWHSVRTLTKLGHLRTNKTRRCERPAARSDTETTKPS